MSRVDLALKEIRSPADPDLATLAALMQATFADPNICLSRDRLAGFVACPGSGRTFHVLAVRRAGAVLGGCVFSYVPAGNCGFSEYIVVGRAHRGAGLGRLLFDGRKALLDALARAAGWAGGCRGLFIEVENPYRTPAAFLAQEQVTSLDPFDRWRIFRRLGFLLADLAYTQPPLGPDKAPVDYMDLLFAPWDAGARAAAAVPAAWVLQTVAPIWHGWAPAGGAAHLQRLARRLGGRPVALHPLPASGGDGMSRSEELRDLKARFVAPAVFHVTPVVAERAEGALLWDADGRRYIDFAAGIGVANLGHSHPEVLAAAQAQLAQAQHLGFHVVLYEGYMRLAQQLDARFPGPGPTRSVLVNSGAEAVENALKIARAATGRELVIAFQNSFHGRTCLAMSATGKSRLSGLPFLRSLAPGVIHVPYPYPYRAPAAFPTAAAMTEYYAGLVEQALDTVAPPEHVAAILAEPVQGEGGFVVPPAPFFRRLRALCDRHGILLVADEVQTGFGRTGRWFAMEHWGAAPDLLVTAKALGAGFPLGAVTGRAAVMDAVPAGALGSTFGGHPVACAAALKMIEVMARDRIPERAAALGAAVRARLEAMQQRFACIGEVRGLGAMQAIELVQDRESRAPAPALVAAVSAECTRRGLITIKAGLYGNVIRLLMPLTIGPGELEEGLGMLEAALAACQ